MTNLILIFKHNKGVNQSDLTPCYIFVLTGQSANTYTIRFFLAHLLILHLKGLNLRLFEEYFPVPNPLSAIYHEQPCMR
jgi:hypothetical protein